MNKSIRNTKGFTLIELLIVIGLLGALTALVLPSLTADREEAMGNVCDYNQSGTVRTLKQFKQLTGTYPNDMHTALQSNSSSAIAMTGLPDAQYDHMIASDANSPCPSVYQLTDADVGSLAEAGIISVCYDTGFNSEELAEGDYVVRANNGSAWMDDGDPAAEMTFDGISITNWESGDFDNDGTLDEEPGVILVFWIAPTTDWTPDISANKDWGNGNVELGIDLEGQCPIPAEAASGDEVSFAYYMAYFKVYSDGTTPAKMVGSTCPECGVLNP